VQASVFIGTSLDGYIARPDGAFDFLPTGGGEPHGYEEFIATVDALVIGRNTFDTVLSFGSWPYGKTPVFVLTSRSSPSPPAGAVVEFMDGEPAEIVSRLSSRGIQHIYVDGGITIQRFLRAGLIQRLIITRVPVLIGEGIPLFGRLSADISLRHIATRSFRGGLVQSEYHLDNVRGQHITPLW
jgi:dihydrofolate reductase